MTVSITFAAVGGVLLHLKLIEAGRRVEYETRYGHRKVSAVVDRIWRVSIARHVYIPGEGHDIVAREMIGHVSYELVERNLSGHKWKSPVWRYGAVAEGYMGSEEPSKTACLERIVQQYKQSRETSP